MRDGLWTFRVPRTLTLRLPAAGWFTWSGSGRGAGSCAWRRSASIGQCPSRWKR